LHSVEANDGSFKQGQSSGKHEQAMPYRVAVQYLPWIKPAYTVTTMGSGSGGSYPPLIGYAATIYVFDSATGQLLQSLPSHAQKAADSTKGAANPYLRAQVYGFLSNIDPTYVQR
jgi:hypothetical protein